MKKYKLLKDLPFIKAGLIFDKDGNDIENGGRYELIEKIMKFSDSSLLLGDWFEEIVEKKSIYNLKKGDKYYVITSNGVIQSNILANDEYDIGRLECGNIFLTREDAEKELAKRKARTSIEKWIYFNDNGYKFINGMDNYYNYYSYVGKCFTTSYLSDYRELSFFFSSEKIAEKALKELESEFKILFDI